jgi:hypothetical protein
MTRIARVAGLALVLLMADSGLARACSSKPRPCLLPQRLALASAAAPAGRMTGLVRTQVQGPTYTPAMDNYYRRALERNAPRVLFPAWLRQQVARTSGVPESSGVIDYLKWRRNLNTTRFDRCHPDLADVLTRTPPVLPQAILPPLVVPPVPILPIPEVPFPQIPINPPQVPEPSTALILAGLFAGAWWARWSRRWAVSAEGQADGPVA